MGKKQNAIYAELLKAIKSMQDPKSNPAQDFLTNQAIEAANWMKKGDYSQLPKGMVFDFQMPAEQMKQYQMASNVSKDGTFALGDDGMGSKGAMATQGKFLGDKFARDAAQNYQNNISGVGQKASAMLGQAAGAKSGNDQAIIAALQGLYGSPALNKPGIAGAVMGMIGGIGGGALSSLKPW
jgi:hypothetical protein